MNERYDKDELLLGQLFYVDLVHFGPMDPTHFRRFTPCEHHKLLLAEEVGFRKSATKRKNTT